MIERREIVQWDKGETYAALFPEGARDEYAVRGGKIDLRLQLGEAQNWRCCYCGIAMNRWRNGPTLCTVEHVIPASAGGRVCWETCVAACRACNNADGVQIAEEGRTPLTARLCPRCGTDHVRPIGARAIRCDLCGRQFSLHTANDFQLASVPFSALRRVTGEMIVSEMPVARLAHRLQNEILRTTFLPIALTEALMRLAEQPLVTARLRSDDLVEIYDEVISELWDRYTLKSPRPPRGGRTRQTADRFVHRTYDPRPTFRQCRSIN